MRVPSTISVREAFVPSGGRTDGVPGASLNLPLPFEIQGEGITFFDNQPAFTTTSGDIAEYVVPYFASSGVRTVVAFYVTGGALNFSLVWRSGRYPLGTIQYETTLFTAAESSGSYRFVEWNFTVDDKYSIGVIRDIEFVLHYVYNSGPGTVKFLGPIYFLNANTARLGATAGGSPASYQPTGVGVVVIVNAAAAKASVTATAYNASITTNNSHAGLASVTATGYNATVSTSNIHAGVAQVVVTGYNASLTDTNVHAGRALVTVTAYNAVIATSYAAAGVARVTIVANNAKLNIQPNAGSGSVTGTGSGSGATIAPTENVANVTTTAYNAIVSGGSVFAAAGVANVTVTGFDAKISIKPNAGAGLVSGTSNNPASNESPTQTMANVVVSAYNATTTTSTGNKLQTESGFSILLESGDSLLHEI